MLARYLNAPLLLLIWQIAPIEARRDEGGRVRVAFGAGLGSFRFNELAGYPAGMSCGEAYPARAPSSETMVYRSEGAAAEVWARHNIRVWAAIGGVTDYSRERNGTFGAVQVALEQKQVGIGLGLATLGGAERSLQPSVSLRYGSLDRFSIRADYRHPDAAMGLAGGPRIGVGWNQGRSRRARVLFGISTTPVPDTLRRVGGFVELAVPLPLLSRRAGLTVNGFISGKYHGNESKQIGSFQIGGWLQP
jgi:hypothetical protein